MNTVTVVIPETRVERLSSRERRRGQKARRGWARYVTGVNREAKGAYALLSSSSPFLDPGERQLPIGAVVAIADYDYTVQLNVVLPNGDLCVLVSGGTPTLGAVPTWWSTDRQLQSLCDAIERLLTTPLRQIVEEQIALRQADPAPQPIRVDSIARWSAIVWDEPAPVLDTFDAVLLREERTRLAARIAEIDALLAA